MTDFTPKKEMRKPPISAGAIKTFIILANMGDRNDSFTEEEIYQHGITMFRKFAFKNKNLAAYRAVGSVSDPRLPSALEIVGHMRSLIDAGLLMKESAGKPRKWSPNKHGRNFYYAVLDGTDPICIFKKDFEQTWKLELLIRILRAFPGKTVKELENEKLLIVDSTTAQKILSENPDKFKKTRIPGQRSFTWECTVKPKVFEDPAVADVGKLDFPTPIKSETYVGNIRPPAPPKPSVGTNVRDDTEYKGVGQVGTRPQKTCAPETSPSNLGPWEHAHEYLPNWFRSNDGNPQTPSPTPDGFRNLLTDENKVALANCAHFLGMPQDELWKIKCVPDIQTTLQQIVNTAVEKVAAIVKMKQDKVRNEALLDM